MVIILSPSKTLRNEKIEHPHPTGPLFPDMTGQLMRKLQRLSKKKLKNLMDISDNLTELNYERFKDFDDSFDKNEGEPAIFTFKGDVFIGLEADKWTSQDLSYAESRLFILSGLYGILKPSTLVQPYRLEMGSRIAAGRNDNLYQFWGTNPTDVINKALSKEQYLINLASDEYSKAIKMNKINGQLTDISFREWRNGKWTFISYNAKKARGLMARYIVKNRIENPEALKGFNLEGYGYSEELSTANNLFYTK